MTIRDKKRDLHMIFIDLDKALKVSLGEMWWVLGGKKYYNRYIDVICTIVQ